MSAQVETPKGRAAEPAADAAELIRRGRACRRQGDLAAARQCFEAAAAAAPRNLVAATELAATLCDLHELDEAEARYRAVIERAPGHTRALVGLAETAQKRGDQEAALPWLQRAAAAEPEQADIQFRLGRTLLSLGRLEEAEARLRQFLEREPGHAGALVLLAQIANGRGDAAAALALYESAAARDPAMLSAELGKAAALRNLGRLDDAKASYEDLLERAPDHAAALVGLGEIARSQGDPETALRRFEAAAAIRPDRPDLPIRIAETLCDSARFEEARAVYGSLLQTAPAHVGALIGLGKLERRRGDHAAALAHFEAAVAAAPRDPNAWYLLVGTLRSLHRFEEAFATLAKVGKFVGADDLEFQVRQLEHFCVTLQLDKAEQRLLAWGGHRDVPKAAVAIAAELYAALGRWADVLAFFRERVVEGGWRGPYDRMIEPLTRAARATGRYAELRELLDLLPDASSNETLRRARDQIGEETRLLRLVGGLGSRHETVEPPVADPFRRDRSQSLARLLRGEPPGRDRARIFTCADAAYLIGASVTLFSLLRHNMEALRGWQFTVFCADDVFDIGSSVFSAISGAFAAPIEVRPSSSLFRTELQLRTGWGVFTPGHGLSQAAYYRIYGVRQLLDEGATGRVLYIDADTCVYAGIDRLLALDLGQHPLAAHLDEESNPWIRRAAALLGLEPDRYFNSGVLLFDLDHSELRPRLERSIEIALSEQHRLTFVDQCALNLAFAGAFATLPDCYNLFVKPDTDSQTLPPDPTIVHFLTRPKPWDPMYATANCMGWLKELTAMAQIVPPELIRRLIALQYPTTRAEAQAPAAARIKASTAE